MFSWISAHWELVAWVIASLAGAALPAENKAGIVLRRLATDLAGKNAAKAADTAKPTDGAK